MGIFSFLKKQFIDVIDWTEDSAGVLAYRYPMEDREIQNGAKLTVRDTQLALFVNEGQIADLMGPGLHTLNTKTLPLLTNLKNWDKLFASPFKSDIYYFSTREQIDQKWGTANPIVIQDKDFGAIRLRAHGTYSFKIKDPKTFYKKISGTQGVYTAEELTGQLRAALLTSLATFLGNSRTPFIEMAANQNHFSETLKTALRNLFNDYGLSLETFFVQSLSLPENLQEYLDKAASMKMVGDLKRYAQFQTADSIAAAASNPGGAAGVGAGLGAGMAIGQTMAAAMGTGFGGGAGGEDVTATIEKLHDLLKKGIITQADFESKKAELLKKIT